MQNERISEQIRSFIGRTFPVARNKKVANDQDLLETGILDSLGVLELVAFIEKEYGMSVNDDELMPENFRSVDQLTAFVRGKRNGADGTKG